MEDPLIKAKKKLLQKFFYTSAELISIPIEYADIYSSVCIYKNKILINKFLKGIQDYSLFLFLLLSAILMHNFAVDKRAHGFYKIIYYLASAIYSNELAFRYLSDDISREDIIKKYKVECFDYYATLLQPDIKSREDLLKNSIDDIYKILLSKLYPLKKDIENLLLAICRKDSASLENIKNILQEKLADILNTQFSDFYSSRIVEHLVAAAERYMYEYLSKKANVNIAHLFKEDIHRLLTATAGSSTIHYSKYIELKISYRNIEEILKNLILFSAYAPTNEGYYDFRHPSKKVLSLKRKIGNIFIPKYCRLKKLKICFIIDTSASISDYVYSIFIDILLKILSLLRNNVCGKILFFSGDVVKEINLSCNVSLIKKYLSERTGYGGTVFHKALEKIKGDNIDYLIIFTDGDFYDGNSLNYYYKDLEKYKGILLITTQKIPEIFKKLKNIKIVKIFV